MTVSIRRPTTDEEFEKVVQLQNRYLKANMREDERGGGFLSNSFSVDQFKAIDRDCSVTIAVNESSAVVGFLCASTWDAMKTNAIVAAMIASVDMSRIDPQTTCIAGPVCIDDSARGQGLMGKLYDFLQTFLKSSTPMRTMMVFINEINVASIKAHEKAGFETIATFEHAEAKYLTLVRV